MNGKPRILVINGSYREDGITDQAVEAASVALRESGADLDTVLLRDYPIGFCLNCRECTQQPGDAPGQCVLHDGMEELIHKMERADGYILASPTNFGSVTAVFKRFMERLMPYAYWPWSESYPKFRKQDAQRKKAVLISSCAAPGILGRWLYGSHKQLKSTAQTMGAVSVGTLFTGRIAGEPHQRISQRARTTAGELAAKLI